MSGDDDKTALEMAVTRLYRYSASEQPSKSVDAHILKKARRAVYVPRVFYTQAAMAASLFLLIFAGAFLVDKFARFSRPHASVLGPWVPLEAQLDATSVSPSYRDRRLLALSKYELLSPEFTSVTLDANQLDLRDFIAQAREGLPH